MPFIIISTSVVVKQVARANSGTVTTKLRLAVTVDEVDQLLESWIRTVLADVSVTLAKPQEAQTGVSLYLLDLAHAPLARAVKDRPPHRIMLRYLITAQGTDPHEMHWRLGELLFAALDSPELEVETEPLPEAVWTALNLAPPTLAGIAGATAPGARRGEARSAGPHPAGRKIRTHPVTQWLRARTGRHWHPRSTGGAACVESFYSDPLRGQCRFPTVPSEPPVKVLRVKAKGRTISVPVDRPEEAIIIHLQESEEQATLNPHGVNCIRLFPGEGIRVYGARTLADSASEWRYLNVRRLFNMVKESLLA